jgi:hypothetical protein
VLGFKLPASIEARRARTSISPSTDQRVNTTKKAFAHYNKDMMKVQFGIVITEAVFDRDTPFNEEFSGNFLCSPASLRSIGVHPGTAGAEDHDKLGPIETYWESRYMNVTAALTHTGLDETHWKFASNTKSSAAAIWLNWLVFWLNWRECG